MTHEQSVDDRISGLRMLNESLSTSERLNELRELIDDMNETLQPFEHANLKTKIRVLVEQLDRLFEWRVADVRREYENRRLTESRQSG